MIAKLDKLFVDWICLFVQTLEHTLVAARALGRFLMAAEGRAP